MNKRDDQGTHSQLLRALGHPLRQAILKEVADTEEISPQECGRQMGVIVSTVAYHFRKLAECDAIALVRTEPVRGSIKHYYRFAVEESWALEALGLPSSPESL